MYWDTSYEEDFFDYHSIYRNRPYWPYLQLYEDDVFDLKRDAEEKVHKQLEEGVPREKIIVDDYYRLYEAMRFFKSIEGFHKGNLDLTGRHMPRYEYLITQFKTFVEDFHQLSLTVDAEEVEETRNVAGRRSFTFKYVDYKMKDLNMWDDFVKQWHVCYAGYGSLKDHVEEIAEVLKQSPYPKFQELCLLDLPEEILDVIFSLADLNRARLLSSTCQKLREIGRPYIFMFRTLRLDFPADFWTKRTEKVKKEDIPQLIIDTIKICRSDLLSQANFLLERPDLMDATKKLWLATPAKEYGAELDDGDFYQPIYQAFSNVVLNCKNLRHLTFSKVDFNSIEIFQAIVTLPELLILDIRACYIAEPVVIGMFTGAIEPSTSVLNLMLYEIGRPGFEIWVPVLLFPNLRSLAVRNFGGEHGLALRAPDLLQIPARSSKVFSSLERLHITSIDDEVVASLTRWIQLNTAETALKLTHLKLSAQVGLEEQFLIQLLDAMRNSPLQVLVLDGIKEGSLVLFGRIAANCPDLLALTVFRRENMRQREIRPATWPHATWEYAARFSAFQRLEHFSWNFRIPEYFEVTPALLLYLEDGFLFDSEDDVMYSSREDDREDDYFKDGYYVAYPFAAHCPTLKSFSINAKKLSDVFCYIKRRDSGIIELIKVDIWRDTNAYSYFRSWDLNHMSDLHWPHVKPKSSSHVEEVA